MGHDLVIVGGPNGAGKTTFAESYSAMHQIPYLGADKIAYDLAPDDPYSKRLDAGSEFITRLNTALTSRKSVIVESTLAGKSLRNQIQLARAEGFRVLLFYLFLDSADLCVNRVNERVQKGGHSVPENDIRRRFCRSIINFWDVYRSRADNWFLVQNSTSDSFDIALGTTNTISIRDAICFQQFQQLVEACRNG